MNRKNQLVQQYQSQIDNISAKEFNEDQKMLCKELLSKTDDDKLEAVYQFLAQRLKKGFVFDVAPELNGNVSAILVRDVNLSFGESNNRLIIGENYDALKNLVELNKQNNRGDNTLYDVIYIDPPYNTEATAKDGNGVANDKENIKGVKFIYRDKFSGQGWLNLMNERLKMAKQLLAEDGFIAISIDNRQQAELRLLGDEIFGIENFITSMVWQKKTTASGSDKSGIDNNTEFIHLWAKNKSLVKFTSQPIKEAIYDLEDEYVTGRGKYYLADLGRVSSKSSFEYLKSLDYQIQAPDGTWFTNYHNILKPQSHCYTVSQELFNYMQANDFIVFKLVKDKKAGNQYWKVYRKTYRNVTIDRAKPYRIITRSKGQNWNNLIIDGAMTTARGGQELKSILGHKDFPFPKPVNLITHLINLHPNKNARVLDFFAGSGTTGHAVLELNRQDGGNRVYTLVTNNQNGIGERITYERLYRINQGVGTKGKEVEWVKKNQAYGTGLDVYSIDYCDNNLNASAADLDNFAKKWNKLLIDFGVNARANAPRAILKALTALAPQQK